MVFASGKIRLAWFGALPSGLFVPPNPDRCMTTVTPGVIGTACGNVSPLSHRDLSKQLFRLKVATLLKSLAEEAMCSLNPSQRKITSGSRAMGLVLKRLLTLQCQKIR